MAETIRKVQGASSVEVSQKESAVYLNP